MSAAETTQTRGCDGLRLQGAWHDEPRLVRDDDRLRTIAQSEDFSSGSDRSV
jgi:hypothetical protein